MSESDDVFEIDTLPKKNTYFRKLSNIALNNLRKMKKIEFILIILEILLIFSTIYVYYLINFKAIEILSSVIQINHVLWRTSITEAYYLSWIQIVISLITVIIRSMSRSYTKVPTIYHENLTKKQIYGDEKFIDAKMKIISEDKKSNKFRKKKKDIQVDQDGTNQNNKEFNAETAEIDENTLRNHNAYYLTGIFTIILIIGFLNYFPRGELLFPSYILIENTTGFITRPAEYTTFFMLNIMFLLTEFLLGIFQLFFSIRQRKDINQVIEKANLKNIKNKQNENSSDDWKPPLPKPWKIMTITEKRDYKAKLFKIEKERAIEADQTKLKKMILDEKEKIRLGKKNYKLKKKEEQKLNKKHGTDKKEEKKIKEKKNDRQKYDFR
jgi:hypothetical protein